MCRLIESIKLLDGVFYNLHFHERRMKYAVEKLFGGACNISLQHRLIASNPPDSGLFKCRIIYDKDTFEVAYIPYAYALIQSLKVVESNKIEYEHKTENRVDINNLYNTRGTCDDVIIVKNGLVTDASSANILLKRDKCWYTPHKPLLKGTKRAELLDKDLIKEKEIPLADVNQYESVKLINAMRGLEQPEIDVSRIVF